METSNKLYDLLLNITTVENGQHPDVTFKRKLWEVFEYYVLTDERQIPKWLVDFFGAVLERRVIDHTEFIETSASKEFYFLHALEDILPGEWDDEGEFTSIYFLKHNICATVWWMGNTYEVS